MVLLNCSMNLGRGKRPFALTKDVAVLIHTCIQQPRSVSALPRQKLPIQRLLVAEGAFKRKVLQANPGFCGG